MNFETLYDRLINGEEKLALIGLIDVKAIYQIEDLKASNINWWRL